MNCTRVFCLILVLASAGAVAEDKPKDAPKAPPSLTQIIDRSFSNLEREFVPAVEAMPEDKFGFAPTNGEFKGVRTFRQQAMHVAFTNYQVASAILGEDIPVKSGTDDNGPANITSKADVLKFVKDSFAYTHKALATVNDKNINGWIRDPFGGKRQATRLGAAMITTWHSFDHYGQMVEYLRMNGIIPPASRQQ